MAITTVLPVLGASSAILDDYRLLRDDLDTTPDLAIFFSDGYR